MKRLVFGITAGLIAFNLGYYHWNWHDWQEYIFALPAWFLFWFMLDCYARAYIKEKLDTNNR